MTRSIDIAWRSLLVAAAVAGTTATAAPAQTPAAQPTLSPAEIARKIEAAGYTNVHDLEFDDGRWEAEATSPAGVAVDLEVDAATGKILHEDRD